MKYTVEIHKNTPVSIIKKNESKMKIIACLKSLIKGNSIKILGADTYMTKSIRTLLFTLN
jgi:hypothetical protein